MKMFDSTSFSCCSCLDFLPLARGGEKPCIKASTKESGWEDAPTCFTRAMEGYINAVYLEDKVLGHLPLLIQTPLHSLIFHLNHLLHPLLPALHSLLSPFPNGFLYLPPLGLFISINYFLYCTLCWGLWRASNLLLLFMGWFSDYISGVVTRWVSDFFAF